MSRFRLSFFLIVAFAYVSTLAYPDDSLKTKRAFEARRYTVEIVNRRGDVFTGKKEGKATGSGFIVELEEKNGLIYTNSHVVHKNHYHAQQLLLRFFTNEDYPEEIPGKVVFDSPIYDFAIVQFDPSKLRRAHKLISTATLASKKDLKSMGVSGTSVMAAGSPLSLSDTFTFGTITGERTFPESGKFLQTDASINPGNSGGPLVHLDSGKVLAINTLKGRGDNIGFSIPISTAIEEQNIWEKNADYASARSMMAQYGKYPRNWLIGLGHGEKLDSVQKDFLKRYEGIFHILKCDARTNFQPGDLILEINGVVIGDRSYLVNREVARSEKEMTVKLLRHEKEVLVQCPITPVWSKENIEVKDEYATFSGFVFEEVSAYSGFSLTKDKTRVIISRILPASLASQGYSNMSGAFIAAVHVNGKRETVKHLSDLKTILSDYKKPALTIELHRRLGSSVVAPDPSFVVIPFGRVITDDDKSLKQLREAFDFTGFKNPKSRRGLSGSNE